jgi:hypothetical protein
MVYDEFQSVAQSEFGANFDTFKSSAFRLEQLSLYSVEEESTAFEAYKSGKEIPRQFNSEWNTLLSEAAVAGKVIERVRVIDGPLTTYQTFEILMAYRTSVTLGEDIRFLLRSEIDHYETFIPVNRDFWLFDNEKCFLMEYDYVGKLLGISQVPHKYVHHYLKLKNELVNRSIDFDEGIRRLKLNS